MARIPCFLLEPTDQVDVRLRRYAHAQDACPVHGYHDASIPIEREPVDPDPEYPDIILNGLKQLPIRDDSRWPTTCDCGYVFQDADEWQRFVNRLYRRVDTGEDTTLRDAPAGAMWYAPWLDRLYVPQGPHNLMVKTPGGEWCVDGQANNCTMKEDFKQEKHHCWVREGVPPLVTAGKDGPTCAAGAGSIQCGSYHGFLREGFLVE